MRYPKRKLYLFLLLSCLNFAAWSDNTTHSQTKILEAVMPAVVNIRAEGTLPPIIYLDEQNEENARSALENTQHPQEKRFMALGSGVIVAKKKGYIITNAHVVKDAEKIVVTLKNGRHYQAKLLGTDEASDIAILQIHANDLTEIEMANSDTLQVGEPVVAIGNPFGLGESVTSGIISALKRSNLQLEGYENFIQIDAPINFGNSGGALVNQQGKLIGMNTAILTPNKGSVGIGFAIPSNMLTNVAKQLVKYGKVERGIIGIVVQTVTPMLADALNMPEKTGAIVTQVLPHSSAEKAGIQVGDIVTSINGTAIESAAQLVNIMGFMRIKTDTTFTIERNQETLSKIVKIQSKDQQESLSEKARPFLYGLGLENTTQYIPNIGKVSGILVNTVKKNSIAKEIGLKRGDIIVKANQQTVANIQALNNIVEKTPNYLILNLVRKKTAILLVIPKELP